MINYYQPTPDALIVEPTHDCVDNYALFTRHEGRWFVLAGAGPIAKALDGRPSYATIDEIKQRLE